MSSVARMLAVIALVVAGCSARPASTTQNALADIDMPEKWLPMPVDQFVKDFPAFVKALEAGELKFPDPHTALVANEGMQTFKVRIEKGKITEAWRERPAE